MSVTVVTTSLHSHLIEQLTGLCSVTGADPATAGRLLADLLGPAGTRPVGQPPGWPSGIADDHTPVEYSLAFHPGGPATLRILAEAAAAEPTAAAHLAAALAFVRTQAGRHGLTMSSFDQVYELFAPAEPHSDFTIWQSLVFPPGRGAEFKVYLNPEVNGVDRAPELVRTALDRLGLGAAYRTLIEHSVRPGELGRADRLAFFALDLHDGPHARVKLYLTHHDATADDMVRAAGAVTHIDPGELREFCRIAGGHTGRFANLPLIGSYTFTAGVDVPVGYSLYVPIRGYVDHDGEARQRVVALLHRYGMDAGVLDRAIAAVTARPLADGVGLIAHVSLRLGLPRPGVTVYLSAEAYQVQPPGPARMRAARPGPEQAAGRSTIREAEPSRSKPCP